jgi:hypothetical protein
MKFISLLLFSFVVLSATPVYATCPAHAAEEEANAAADGAESKCPHAEKTGECPHSKGGEDGKAGCSKCADGDGESACPDCKAGCDSEEGCPDCKKGCGDGGCEGCAEGCDKSESEGCSAGADKGDSEE